MRYLAERESRDATYTPYPRAKFEFAEGSTSVVHRMPRRTVWQEPPPNKEKTYL